MTLKMMENVTGLSELQPSFLIPLLLFTWPSSQEIICRDTLSILEMTLTARPCMENPELSACTK